MVPHTELEIVWDGPVKGLSLHRVSLSAFGESLDLLMKAARRIASQKLQAALEPTSVGRLANSAKFLDIELSETKKGSGGFSTFITFDVPDSSGQSLLFNQLPEIVGKELIESIRAEASGTLRNVAVRKYLKSLPANLTLQDYKLHNGGHQIDRVEIGGMSLPIEDDDPMPSFGHFKGRIVGVGFDPKWEVKIKGHDGTQVVASATEKQVNNALEMRSAEVSALTVTNAAGTRLLVLESDERPAMRPTIDDIFVKWDATYRALA